MLTKGDPSDTLKYPNNKNNIEMNARGNSNDVVKNVGDLNEFESCVDDNKCSEIEDFVINDLGDLLGEHRRKGSKSSISETSLKMWKFKKNFASESFQWIYDSRLSDDFLEDSNSDEIRGPQRGKPENLSKHKFNFDSIHSEESINKIIEKIDKNLSKFHQNNLTTNEKSLIFPSNQRKTSNQTSKKILNSVRVGAKLTRMKHVRRHFKSNFEDLSKDESFEVINQYCTSHVISMESEIDEILDAYKKIIDLSHSEDIASYNLIDHISTSSEISLNNNDTYKDFVEDVGSSSTMNGELGEDCKLCLQEEAGSSSTMNEKPGDDCKLCLQEEVGSSSTMYEEPWKHIYPQFYSNSSMINIVEETFGGDVNHSSLINVDSDDSKQSLRDKQGTEVCKTSIIVPNELSVSQKEYIKLMIVDSDSKDAKPSIEGKTESGRCKISVIGPSDFDGGEHLNKSSVLESERVTEGNLPNFQNKSVTTPNGMYRVGVQHPDLGGTQKPRLNDVDEESKTDDVPRHTRDKIDINLIKYDSKLLANDKTSRTPRIPEKSGTKKVSSNLWRIHEFMDSKMRLETKNGLNNENHVEYPKIEDRKASHQFLVFEKSSRKFTRIPKILLIGRKGCGKTCFINSLIHKTFTKKIENYNSNGCLSISIRLPTMDRIKVNIFEYSGQVSLNFPAFGFFSEMDGYIICTDNVSSRSLEEIETWVKSIREKNDGGIFTLAVTKVDKLCITGKIRGEITSKCDELGIKDYFETSAKTGANLYESLICHVMRIIHDEGRVQKDSVLKPKVMKKSCNG